jgi:hypothetical protein
VFSGDDEDEEVRPRSRPKSARKSATIQWRQAYVAIATTCAFFIRFVPFQKKTKN